MAAIFHDLLVSAWPYQSHAKQKEGFVNELAEELDPALNDLLIQKA